MLNANSSIIPTQLSSSNELVADDDENSNSANDKTLNDESILSLSGGVTGGKLASPIVSGGGAKSNQNFVNSKDELGILDDQSMNNSANKLLAKKH